MALIETQAEALAQGASAVVGKLEDSGRPVRWDHDRLAAHPYHSQHGFGRQLIDNRASDFAWLWLPGGEGRRNLQRHAGTPEGTGRRRNTACTRRPCGPSACCSNNACGRDRKAQRALGRWCNLSTRVRPNEGPAYCQNDGVKSTCGNSFRKRPSSPLSFLFLCRIKVSLFLE